MLIIAIQGARAEAPPRNWLFLAPRFLSVAQVFRAASRPRYDLWYANQKNW